MACDERESVCDRCRARCVRLVPSMEPGRELCSTCAGQPENVARCTSCAMVAAGRLVEERWLCVPCEGDTIALAYEEHRLAREGDV